MPKLTHAHPFCRGVDFIQNECITAQLLFHVGNDMKAKVKLVKTTQLFLMLTTYEVKLLTTCSCDLKSSSLRDQQVLCFVVTLK